MVKCLEVGVHAPLWQSHAKHISPQKVKLPEVRSTCSPIAMPCIIYQSTSGEALEVISTCPILQSCRIYQ